MLSTTAAIYGQGLGEEVALITDGRFFWSNTRFFVLVILVQKLPVAGAIALIKNGDIVEIDAEKRFSKSSAKQ